MGAAQIVEEPSPLQQQLAQLRCALEDLRRDVEARTLGLLDGLAQEERPQ
jgi:hypothetical protein